ncbi:MAG: patatin-like phospholipase family protein, partial [Cytophagales bacterium]
NFSFGGHSYIKDRGYAFERQLDLNSEGVLWKPIKHYKEHEKRADIPMMILSPTVVNDGRKLYISAQPISYMCSSSLQSKMALNNQRLKGIEFMRFFQEQNADSLSFLSALRMSATFPYITPTVTLPSFPEMEIMDAGLTDNFGFTDAIRFLHVFKDWIAENTSGVVIVSIRDSKKELEIEKSTKQGIFQKLFVPVGSLYTSWDYFQDINNDNLVDYARTWFKNDLQVVDFQYIPKPKYWDDEKMKHLDLAEIERLQKMERASLSWHLTIREKESLKRTIFESNNLASMKKLNMLLEE